MNSDEDEGLYLLHTREFITTNEPIYKIGRSNKLDNRVKQYPNGSKIMLMIKCKNTKTCENNLKKLFKTKFMQKTYYGTEYFEGNYVDMIKEICDYVNNFNITFVDDIKKDEKIIEQTVEQTVENKVDNKVDNKVEQKKCDRTCSNCNHIFRFPSDLKKHLKISFHCKKTNVEIEDYFNNINNTNNITNKNKSVSCLICNKEFTRKYSLERHLKSSNCSKNTK